MALPAILSNDDIAKFRTSTCERFAATGECLFSSRCQYSHNIEWRRRSPLKYRYEPRLCDHYSQALCYIMMDTDPTDNNNTTHHHPPRRMRCRCPLGRSCRLSHSEEEVLFHPWVYKALLCEDVCCTRYYCPFAHCPEEVRASPLSQDELRQCLAPFLRSGAQHRQAQQQHQQELSGGLVAGEPSFAVNDDDEDGGSSGDDSINSIVDDIAATVYTETIRQQQQQQSGAVAGATARDRRGMALVSPSIASTTNEASGVSSRELSETEEQQGEGVWDIMGDGRVMVYSNIAHGAKGVHRAKEKDTRTKRGGGRLSTNGNKSIDDDDGKQCLAKIIPIKDEGEEQQRDVTAFLHNLQRVFPDQILLSNNKASSTSSPSTSGPFEEPIYHNRCLSRVGGIRQIVRELALLARSPHTNIVNISHIYEESTGKIVVTITECDMSLNEMLAGFGASIDTTDPSSTALSGDMVQILARDLTAGLQRMHFFNIYHGRLSANNVLVDLPSGSRPSGSRVIFRIGDHIGKVKLLDIINKIRPCSTSSSELTEGHTTTAAGQGGGRQYDDTTMRMIVKKKAKEILSEGHAKEGWYPPEVAHILQMLSDEDDYDVHSIESLLSDIDWSLVDVWGLGAVILFAITGVRPKQWEDRLPDPATATADAHQTTTTCKQLFGRHLDPLFLDYLSRMVRRRPCYREPLATTACHPLLRDPQSILDSIRRLPIPTTTNRAPSPPTSCATERPPSTVRMYDTPFHLEHHHPRYNSTITRNDPHNKSPTLDDLSRTPSQYHGDARVFCHICQVPLSLNRGDPRGTVLDILSYVRRKVDDMDHDGGEGDFRALQDTVSLLLKNPATLILTFDAERISQYLTLSDYINRFHQRYLHLNLSWMMMMPSPAVPHSTIEQQGYHTTDDDDDDAAAGVEAEVDGLLSDIVSYRTFVHDALLV